MANLTIEQRELSQNQFKTVMTMSRLKQTQTEFEFLKKKIEAFPKDAKTNYVQYREAIEPCIKNCTKLLPDLSSKVMYDLVSMTLGELKDIPNNVPRSRLREESLKCLNSVINDINEFIEPMWFIGY